MQYIPEKIIIQNIGFRISNIYGQYFKIKTHINQKYIWYFILFNQLKNASVMLDPV